MKQNIPSDTRFAFEESAAVVIALCAAVTIAAVLFTLLANNGAERNRCNAACVEARG